MCGFVIEFDMVEWFVLVLRMVVRMGLLLVKVFFNCLMKIVLIFLVW